MSPSPQPHESPAGMGLLRRPRPLFLAAAFSLIELLVVIAIIALLASFAVPAFSSIGQARGVSEAAYQIAAAVEFGRSEAISRQTFVWMGIEPQTNSGNLDLRIGLVCSADGTANTNATNLQAIARPLLLQRVAIAAASGLDVGTNLGPVTDLATNSSGATFQIGQVKFGGGRTVVFTPMGEVCAAASPATNGFEPRLAIGLRQVRGTIQATNNDVAIVIDGSIGIPTIYKK